jgi:hypothetical protein
MPRDGTQFPGHARAGADSGRAPGWRRCLVRTGSLPFQRRSTQAAPRTAEHHGSGRMELTAGSSSYRRGVLRVISFGANTDGPGAGRDAGAAGRAGLPQPPARAADSRFRIRPGLSAAAPGHAAARPRREGSRCGLLIPVSRSLAHDPAAESAPGYSNISIANEFSGSQTGSQRPQAQGHVGPRPAIVTAARRHVRPHPAPSRHTSKVPPKQ